IRDPNSGLDPFFAWDRRYKGTRIGTKLKVPLSLFKSKKDLISFKAAIFYAPNLSMKSSGFDFAWPNPTLSNTSKGKLFELHTGMSLHPYENFVIEVMYNYFQFLQDNGDYESGQTALTVRKAKTKLFGPSVIFKLIF
ncbi:MAG: hypothetical protein ABIH19_00775, partial [Candidatus Omnitrophota bacterium]